MKPESSAASWLKFFTSAGITNQYAEHYAVTFSKNQIQLDMLPEINKDYLNDMGINLLGHVIAILRHAKLVYADEVKRSELPSVRKPESKVIKNSKSPPSKTSKTPKSNEEYEKPSSSVVMKRKSNVAGLQSSESSGPKAKVRKNICDSSDDVTQPKPKQIISIRPISELCLEEQRKGVFKRLGGEVNQSSHESEVSAQTVANNMNGVFSRLGGKTEESRQVVKVPLLPSLKPAVRPAQVSSAQPVVTKSIIRNRLEKSQQPVNKIPRYEPQTYMDRELLKTERKQTSKLVSDKITLSENDNVKSRLGHRSSQLAAPPGSKKVSFGTVSQKLIPKVSKPAFFGGRKMYSQSYPTQLKSGIKHSGVFSRLGTVPR